MVDQALLAWLTEGLAADGNAGDPVTSDARRAALRRDVVSRPAIFVGAGTCGLGAGAGKSLAALRKWLDEHSVDYQFHDFKKDGLDDALLSRWEKSVGWEALINRRGTTWRSLPQAVRDNINAQTAEKIMLEHPASIKRPLLAHADRLFLGFKEADYSALFGQTEKA